MLSLPPPDTEANSLQPVLRAPSRAVDQTKGYLRAQVQNVQMQQSKIQSIKPDDFGQGDYLPRQAHFDAVNALLKRSGAKANTVIRTMKKIEARGGSRPGDLARFNTLKDLAKRRVGATEKIWAFYRDIFEQRKGPFARELAAIDRIGLDCYQACYMGLGKARSIPTPPPLTYIDATTGPATYRRGVLVSRIARNPNPFPLVKLPYSRLISPWSLGAVPHEVGHNLQNDLSLWKQGPLLIKAELSKRGLPKAVQANWMRWHKEIYADLIGVLLIGPAYVASLMDVVGKSPSRVARFRKGAVHPTPIIRPTISNMLLRKINFAQEADQYDHAWRKLYPASVARKLPDQFRRSFEAAAEGTIDALVFRPNAAYGGKRLVDVVCFRAQDKLIVNEAAERLAKGTNPGVIPERFLIAAARLALTRKLATPTAISTNFYNVLLGR